MNVLADLQDNPFFAAVRAQHEIYTTASRQVNSGPCPSCASP